LAEPNNAALVGHTVAGKFLVNSVISTGGTGTVYLARQLALDRFVALKVLHDEVAAQKDFVERFRREARAASRLDHPNSVRVLDFGQDGDALFYLAMEYVEGPTLHELIRADWPLGERRVVEIMSQVLSAVAVAHDMNVVHRDLKPDNIIVIRGRTDEGEAEEIAKVCDFGIALLGAATGEGQAAGPDQPHVTLNGFLMGTPEFMSPEQARGEPADRRSDIYAAGLVLYEMLTRRLPFQGENPYAIVIKHVTETPPPPSTFAPVSPALEAICLRAINKQPADRFANAREMRAALRSLFPASGEAYGSGPLRASPTASAPAVPLAVRPGTRQGQRRLVGGVALAVILSVVVGAVMRGRSRRPAGIAAGAASELLSPPLAHLPEPVPATPPAPAVAVSHRPPQATPAAPTPSIRPGHRHHRKAARGGRTSASAPAVPVAPASAPAAAAPKPEPPATPLDLERAALSITGVTTSNATPVPAIRAALARAPLLHCYREALRAHGAPASGTATLRLHIDVDGYITEATLLGAAFLPAVKGCIEQAAKGARVKDVDTGEGTADLTLSFAS
jgi:serine/threonine-protein kinase